MLGDYELVGKLGAGAMGSVYLAKQVSSGRNVALKILPPDLAKDAEFLERFRREARSAMRIAHPNIVAAYDEGESGGHHYIAMEYIDGPNLETLLQKGGPFKSEQILKVLLDMAAALEAAQKDGIVHRDIKPANILVNSKGENKLTDLGLASASQGDQRVTMAGYAVGTPYYISPEQARGDLDVDIRADVYGLGATIYHLATGQLPFPGNNPVIIMTQHLQEMPPAPNLRNPSVSPQLSALILKMMAKDPKQRHATPADLRDDVLRVQRGEMPLPAVQRVVAAVPAQRRITTQEPTRPTKSPEPRPVAAPAGDPFTRTIDAVFGFLPSAARVPVAAVVVTLTMLAALYVLVKLLKH
jgi:eukaryotic-like serine/threonine-protein kinase